MLTADHIKDLLGLAPLPVEGGYYAETYRAVPLAPSASPDPARRPRATATAIYYLLTAETLSALHRLSSDEIFHFYLGDSVEQLQLMPDGSGLISIIGPDLLAGMRPQVIVPAGVWQGARLAPTGSHGFALLGTTMTPGFDFADYESGPGDELIAAYPAFREMIEALTRRPNEAGWRGRAGRTQRAWRGRGD